MTARLRPLVVPLALAASALALHLACGDRLGFFRDELYFVACGKRLSWGYVDQPPLIAVVARLAWHLSGDGASVAVFRLPAYLCGVALIPAAALLSRRLGGSTFAMALSAAATFGAALPLAQGHLLTMNILELLLWSLVALASVTAANGHPRAWLVAGALVGLSLLTKYSAGLLALGLIAGIAATRSRRALASAWFWAGAALAALLATPSLWWQAAHGFPFLELLRNGREVKNATIGMGALLKGLAMEQGPLNVLLAVAGGLHLLRRDEGPGRDPVARFLALALLGVLAVFTLSGGKPYYLGPAFPPLLAAGAVWVERRLARPALRGAAVALCAAAVLPTVPIAVPLVPPAETLAWMGRLGIEPIRTERSFTQPLPQHLADQVGWPERVAAVEAVAQALSPADRAAAVIYTTNYGRAAALQLLGRGLPPVICGHNQYFLWGVPGDPQVVVALGGRREDYAADFAEVTLAGATPVIPMGMDYESEIPIYVLRGPRGRVRELFLRARRYM